MQLFCQALVWVTEYRNELVRFVLDVEPTDIVGDVLQRIRDKLQLETRIRMVFEGKELMPERQIQDYPIQDGSSVTIVQVLCG